MNNSRILHFTLGPVQGFVAQARRTRDLWAGSFLLSWLSGHAMKAVLEHNGDIVFPFVVDGGKNPVDPLLKAIMKTPDHGSPQIGSLPNRFKASVDAAFDPEVIGKEIQKQWLKLADAVYDQFVGKVAEESGKDTKDIWSRQINNFWEINWVIGDDPGDHSDDHWLDMRKNWRNHWPEEEGGDHCTLMGDFQEISGYIRSKDRLKQDKFWRDIRNAAPDDYLDIRENERLCAIALVKRLFPRLSSLKESIGWIPGKNARAVGNWPSTTYLAVAPWLQYIAEEEERIDWLDDYICGVKKTVNGYFRKLASEQATRLTMLEPLNDRRMLSEVWKLSDIDGDILHIHALKNHRTTYLSDDPLSDSGMDNDKVARGTLVAALEGLYGKLEKRPRSYYALLLMDGDRLGKMLRDEDQAKVSRALLDFTRKVVPCVDEDPEHSGVTIYAGGDDVFALLPLDRAIACAQALRRIFGDAFRKEGIDATASCAIIFAHHQVPLRSAIQEAHYQLEGIAKEKNGRNSLALAVCKSGGVTVQWVSAWKEAPSPMERLMELIERVAQGEYPRGFFHKLQDRYGFYADENLAVSPQGIDFGKLLVAEYMQTRDPTPTLQEAEKAAERLESACRTWSRDAAGAVLPAAVFRMDGGFIARFLTQEED